MPEPSKSEGELTKGISNETVCQYFYWLFVIVAVLSGIVVANDLWIMTKRPTVGLMMLIRSAPTLILGIANALFLYLLCARTLLK